MKKIFENNYKLIEFDEQSKIVHDTWKNTVKLDNDKYLTEMTRIAENVELYKPKGLLVNAINFEYGITPETQEWINKNIFNRFAEAGVTKIAMIMSTDFITALSLEQVMEEGEGFVSHFFAKVEDGLSWLKS